MKKSTIASLVTLSLLAAPAAFAYQKGDVVVRGGLTLVSPDDASSNIIAGDTDLGLGVAVDSNTQIGLNVAYFLTDRINIELLAATPFSHDVDFGVADPLGTGNKLGEVKHLPPTISVNYYFNDPSATFQPYAGLGLNYTVFFDEEFTSANEEAGLTKLDLDDSFGIAAQLGADYKLTDKWHLNASVRWIDIDTSATFELSGAEGKVSDIEIDPWVYTISLGYTF